MPAKDQIHKDLLDVEHRIKAAKRRHNELLADSISGLLPTGGDQFQATNQGKNAPRRGSFLQHQMAESPLQDVEDADF